MFFESFQCPSIETLWWGGSEHTGPDGAGHDYAHGEAGADELYGEAGRDLMFGGDSDDTLDSGPG